MDKLQNLQAQRDRGMHAQPGASQGRGISRQKHRVCSVCPCVCQLVVVVCDCCTESRFSCTSIPFTTPADLLPTSQLFWQIGCSFFYCFLLVSRAQPLSRHNTFVCCSQVSGYTKCQENKEGNKRTARTAHSTARSFLGCCFTHFWLIFSVAETRWLEGFTYNNGGLHSILLTIAMVVVAAHTPCRK